MLHPFVVLVRPMGTSSLSLHGAAAPNAGVALEAVGQSLREAGHGDDAVVGVFRREDLEVLGGVFDQLDRVIGGD